MALLDKRLVAYPVEYPLAEEFWQKQQQQHWLHLSIRLGSDQKDWKYSLSDTEREVVARTLKGFTQVEVIIGNYWASLVPKWFRKPEIQNMAYTFAAFESIHETAYAYLQRELGLNDFDAFLTEPSAKAKIDRLVSVKGSKDPKDIARSLAIFSAFNEGVNLFSSFAILMSFGQRNLLKGVGQIVKYSILDEGLHSQAGCWLFRTLIKENPNLLTDELKQDIYDAARLTVKLEDDFINQAFSLGPIQSIDHEALKAYIRFRTNTKLKDLGLGSIYKNINKDLLNKLDWFAIITSLEDQDFFNNRVTDYASDSANFEHVLSDEAWI
jgi:ribonucleoside-diphosphate reductase beta chain